MKRKNLNLLLFAVIVSTLAACGSADKSAPPPPPPAPPPVVLQENAFGAVFGMAFRADADATPIEPRDGDIIPLSLTTEPIEVR